GNINTNANVQNVSNNNANNNAPKIRINDDATKIHYAVIGFERAALYWYLNRVIVAENNILLLIATDLQQLLKHAIRTEVAYQMPAILKEGWALAIRYDTTIFRTGKPFFNKLQQKYTHKSERENGGSTLMELDYARNSSSNHKHKKNGQKGNCFKCRLPGHYTKNCKSKNKSKLTNIEEGAEPTLHNITNINSRVSCNFINENFVICYKLTLKTVSSLIVELADSQKASTNKAIDITKLELDPYHTSTKVLSNEEIFTIHVNKEDNENTSHLPPEVRKILQNFKKIFSETLPDHLLPEQNIDHAIDLVPESEPPFCPIYQMYYEELDKLKCHKWKGILKGRIRLAILANKELRIQLLYKYHDVKMAKYLV
ncbi:26723_t:CDS:2, partial [Racocetra persica]